MKFTVKAIMKSAVKSINDIHREICNEICSRICNELNEILQNYVDFSKILLDLINTGGFHVKSTKFQVKCGGFQILYNITYPCTL